jgi:hypothetical protein
MTRKGSPANQGHFALFGDRLNVSLGHTVMSRSICDSSNKVSTGLGSVLLQLISVHESKPQKT